MRSSGARNVYMQGLHYHILCEMLTYNFCTGGDNAMYLRYVDKSGQNATEFDLALIQRLNDSNVMGACLYPRILHHL